jgi:hypothetical protein
MCDKQGCTAEAVTERKLCFAYTELCREHAKEYDTRNDPFLKRRDMIRIGR